MTNGAVIARCSQPEVGWFGWRSPEDEALLKAIGTACATDSVSVSLTKQHLRQIGDKICNKNGCVKGIPNGVMHHHKDENSDGSNVGDSEDQSLLGDSSAEGRKVLIVDARAYTAAVVNRAKGGGCECEGTFWKF